VRAGQALGLPRHLPHTADGLEALIS
jgi:hypothetical protein